MTTQKEAIIKDIEKLMDSGAFPSYFKKVIFFTIQNENPTMQWLKDVKECIHNKFLISQK